MPIKSPLTSLVDTIRQVASSAQRYEATLRKNEAATRAVLIDPVLRALGWDMGNTSMVEVEKTLDDTRVDYALYDGNGEVLVIVEAKSLGKPLSDDRIALTLLAYAFKHGVQDVFLTDGITWQHFSDFQPGKSMPVQTISLDDENAVEAAAYLVQRLDAARFWPEDRDIDTIASQVSQLESMVTSLRAELDHLKITLMQPASDAQDLLQISDQSTTVSSQNQLNNLVPLETVTNLTGKRPRLLQLPTGVVVSVRTWKDVLVEACKATMADNAGITVPLPDAAGRKVALLDKIPPPKGLSHVSASYRGVLIYIYTNYDANHCVMNAIHILRHLPREKKLTQAALAFADA